MACDCLIEGFGQLRSFVAAELEEIFGLPAGLRSVGFHAVAFEPGISARSFAVKWHARSGLQRSELTNQLLETDSHDVVEWF